MQGTRHCETEKKEAMACLTKVCAYPRTFKLTQRPLFCFNFGFKSEREIKLLRFCVSFDTKVTPVNCNPFKNPFHGLWWRSIIIKSESKVVLNTAPWDAVPLKTKTYIKMTLFEEQAFPGTKRAKQSQRENVCVWNNDFTAEYCCSSFTRNITHTYTQACALLHKQYVSVHKCTLNISGGSVHSRLPEPQAKCSPQQTDHDLLSSPTLRARAPAQRTEGSARPCTHV